MLFFKIIRRSKLVAVVFASIAVFEAPVFASIKAYSDPTLKVLLFRSSQSVRFSSPSILVDAAARYDLNNRRSVFVKPYRKNKLLVNGTKAGNQSLFLKSQGNIAVRKAKASFSRRYQGIMEIRPSNTGIYVINHIPVEAYLSGVLNAEISTKWSLEVVKAQSIISRTFALYQMERRKKRMWHVTAGLSDQVYLGVNIADSRGLDAIQRTRGIVVTYAGKLAQTFYHSNCGGVTEDAGNLWSRSYPYLQVKQVPYGKSDPRFHWQVKLSDREIKTIFRRMGFQGKTIRKLTVSELNSSGRVRTLVVNGSSKNAFLAKDFRRTAGYRRIQSLLFRVTRVAGGFHFEGTGNGHGVGLSQWSAKEMADNGYNYREILNFFYRGTTLAYYWN